MRLKTAALGLGEKNNKKAASKRFYFFASMSEHSDLKLRRQIRITFINRNVQCLFIRP